MPKDILEQSLPTTLQDVVNVFVAVSGRKDGRLVQETYANKIYSRDIGSGWFAQSLPLVNMHWPMAISSGSRR